VKAKKVRRKVRKVAAAAAVDAATAGMQAVEGDNPDATNSIKTPSIRPLQVAGSSGGSVQILGARQHQSVGASAAAVDEEAEARKNAHAEAGSSYAANAANPEHSAVTLTSASSAAEAVILYFSQVVKPSDNIDARPSDGAASSHQALCSGAISHEQRSASVVGIAACGQSQHGEVGVYPNGQQQSENLRLLQQPGEDEELERLLEQLMTGESVGRTSWKAIPQHSPSLSIINEGQGHVILPAIASGPPPPKLPPPGSLGIAIEPLLCSLTKVRPRIIIL